MVVIKVARRVTRLPATDPVRVMVTEEVPTNTVAKIKVRQYAITILWATVDWVASAGGST